MCGVPGFLVEDGNVANSSQRRDVETTLGTYRLPSRCEIHRGSSGFCKDALEINSGTLGISQGPMKAPTWPWTLLQVICMT